MPKERGYRGFSFYHDFPGYHLFSIPGPVDLEILLQQRKRDCLSKNLIRQLHGSSCQQAESGEG